MVDQTGTDPGDEAESPPTYEPPRLVFYGTVSALTAGGSGPVNENARGRACGRGIPTRRVNPSCP